MTSGGSVLAYSESRSSTVLSVLILKRRKSDGDSAYIERSFTLGDFPAGSIRSTLNPNLEVGG